MHEVRNVDLAKALLVSHSLRILYYIFDKPLHYITLQLKQEHYLFHSDPHFGPDCTADTVNGSKRYQHVPMNVADLPKIDAICYSHDHYDHLDEGSVKDLNDRFGKDCR